MKLEQAPTKTQKEAFLGEIIFPIINLGERRRPIVLDFDTIHTEGDPVYKFEIVVDIPESVLEISLELEKDGKFSLTTKAAGKNLFPILNLSTASKNKLDLIYKNLIEYASKKLNGICILVTSVNIKGKKDDIKVLQDDKKAVQRSFYRERQLKKLFPEGKFVRINEIEFEFYC